MREVWETCERVMERIEGRLLGVRWACGSAPADGSASAARLHKREGGQGSVRVNAVAAGKQTARRISCWCKIQKIDLARSLQLKPKVSCKHHTIYILHSCAYLAVLNTGAVAAAH
jgi:hypothetical protein